MLAGCGGIRGFVLRSSRPTRQFLSSIAADANIAATNEPVPRQKHKPPQKRASSLLNILKTEALEKLKGGRRYPLYRAGDSIEIEVLPYVTSPQSDVVRGLVTAKSNNGLETSVTIINCEYGTPVKRLIKIYDPTVKRITVLQKAFIYNGKKKVRRAKIYYMEKMDPKYWTIPY